MSTVPPQAVIGVDIGGTAIKAWVLGDGSGHALEPIPTPRDDPSGERTADAVAALVGRESSPLAAAGVTSPGIVDDEAGLCVRSVNLGWRDVPIRDLVAARIDLPVVLTHDVRAGATAEKRSGAGAELPGGLVFAALGTGLAIAAVDDAGLPIGTRWAGEVGQLRLVDGPHPGARVEEIASAGGLARRFGAAGALDVAAARTAGDARAVRLWDETVQLLADVLAWSVAVLAPATVVVGGGLALAGDALLDPLRAALDARLGEFPPVALRVAVHGSDAGAVGAAELALLHLERPATG